MIILKGDQKLTTEQTNALVDKTKALVYARVSSDDQVKGHSLDSQVEICAQKARNQFGYSSDEIIALVELGISGDNSDRPAINYAMHLLENGFGQKIFILHPDRLARDLFLQMQFTRRIWSFGCDIEFIESAVDKNNPESMLMYNLQGSIAEYNKSKILANSKRGRRQKAKSGQISGLRRLYGYTFDTEKDILVRNEYESKVYLSMVDMLLYEGKSCSQIAAHLSKNNVPAPNGNVWYQATVSKILKNQAYTGKFHYGKTEVLQFQGKKKQVAKPKEEWIKINIPALIDDQTYEKILYKIRTLSTKKSGRPSPDYLLRGKAKCGRCGAPVVSGVTTKTKNGLIKYYTCIRKTKKGFIVGTTSTSHELCRGRNWRVDIVDDFVWNELKSILSNPQKIIEQIVGESDDTKKLEGYQRKKINLMKSIDDKEKMQERYIDLYASGIIKTKDDLESKLSSVNDQLKELKDDLALVNESIKFISDDVDKEKTIHRLMNVFTQSMNMDLATDEERRALVDILIHKVLLYEDGTIEIELNIRDDAPNDGDKTHKNTIHREGDGINFYVFYQSDLPERTRKIATHPQFEDMLKMYFKDLMSFQQIADTVDEDWWVIKKLFIDNGVKTMTHKERSKLKRAKEFNFLYDLHINQKMTLEEIYKVHKKSPPYVRLVLEENGVQAINYGKFQYR